jgi:hypothetical protein
MSPTTQDYEEGAAVHSNPVVSGDDKSGEAPAEDQDLTNGVEDLIGRSGYHFYEVLCATCIMHPLSRLSVSCHF